MAFDKLRAKVSSYDSYADEMVIIAWTLVSMGIGAGLLLAVQWVIRLATKCHC